MALHWIWIATVFLISDTGIRDVHGEKCSYPIDGLPAITEYYYQRYDTTPEPVAKVSFKTRYPILHHYWLVSQGAFDDDYYPEARVYPVFNYYNGIMSHAQELGPNHHQFVLYSSKNLKSIRLVFVLDIGCRIIIGEVPFWVEANSFSDQEIRPLKITQAPESDIIFENNWISWRINVRVPDYDENEYNYFIGVAALDYYARRNGSRLLSYQVFNDVGAYHGPRPFRTRLEEAFWRYEIKNKWTDMKLRDEIVEATFNVKIKAEGGDLTSGGFLYYRIPFSLRTDQETKPAITADSCQRWRLSSIENVRDEYSERTRNDDGVSPIVLRRRSDTHSCMRIHVNGNPFPEYEIKDLETGEIIPNFPYKLTETYTIQMVATLPVPVGGRRNYQVTAKNSMGTVTRQIVLEGYEETVLTSRPKWVYTYKARKQYKESVLLECEGKGKFDKLGMYNTTLRKQWQYGVMAEAEPDANGHAKVSYQFSNFSAMFNEPFASVVCAMDLTKLNETSKEDRRFENIMMEKAVEDKSEFQI